MDVKVIRNKTECEKALKYLSELIDRNPAPGSKDANTIELLMLVIKDYEQKVLAPIVIDPIEAIKFRIDQMQLSRKDLVPYFGSISRVSEILSGTRNLSLPMIRKLHEGLGIPLESLISRRPKLRRPTRKRKPIQKHRLSRSRKRKKILS